MPSIHNMKKEQSENFKSIDAKGNVHDRRISFELVHPESDMIDEFLLCNIGQAKDIYQCPNESAVYDTKRGHLLSAYNWYDIVVPVSAVADYMNLDNWFDWQSFESVDDWYIEDGDGDSAWSYVMNNADDSDILESLAQYYESHESMCESWKSVGEALGVYADQSGRFAGYVYEDMPMELDDLFYNLRMINGVVCASVVVKGRVILDDTLPAINYDTVHHYLYDNHGETKNEAGDTVDTTEYFKQEAKHYVGVCNESVTYYELYCALYRFNHDTLNWENDNYTFSSYYTSDYLWNDDNMRELMHDMIQEVMGTDTIDTPILWDDPAFELFEFEMWSKPMDLHFTLIDGESDVLEINGIKFMLTFHTGRGTVWAYILTPSVDKEDSTKAVRGFDMGVHYKPEDHDTLDLHLTAREVYRLEAYLER